MTFEMTPARIGDFVEIYFDERLGDKKEGMLSKIMCDETRAAY
jgi:hypothetical protein